MLEQSAMTEKLSLEQVLKLCPIRAPNAECTPEGDQVRVAIRRNEGAMIRLLSMFFTLPARKNFLLDRFGTAVWECCDGKTPVKEMISRFMGRFDWPKDRAERAVLLFLTTLSERKLVNFGPALHAAGGVRYDK